MSAPVHWLLDLSVGGLLVRLADVDLDVTTEDGRTLSYFAAASLGGLEIALGAGPTAAAITVDAYCMPHATWADLVAHGAWLPEATATLRRWTEGSTLEAGSVTLLQGRLRQPESGDLAEPLTFGLDSSRWDSSETVPPATAVVDPTTWPVTTTPYPLYGDPSAIGAVYPWVFGYPGRGASIMYGDVELSLPTTPGFVAEYGPGAHTWRDSKLLIAGHAVAAGDVRVTDLSGGYRPAGIEETLPVLTTADLRGRVVSYVDLADAEHVRVVQGNQYSVEWYTALGGGLTDAQFGDADGLVRGAGAVISYLCREADVRVDQGRLAAARARLDRYGLDFALTSPVRPEEWVEGRLGAILPLLRREGPDGVWWELWRYDGRLQDVAAHLVFGGSRENCERVSRFRWRAVEDVVTEIELRYLTSTTGYKRTIRAVPGSSPDLTARERGSRTLAVGATRREGGHLLVVETPLVAEDSTAELVLQGLIDWRGVHRREVTVEAGPGLDHLRPNDVVTYTEDAASMSGMLALVQTVGLSLTRTTIELLLLERTA